MIWVKQLWLRCVEVLGEYDLRDATTAMGRCLFHLQRDLLLETWTVRTEEQSTPQLCARTTQKPLQKLAIKAASRAALTRTQQKSDSPKNPGQ